MTAAGWHVLAVDDEPLALDDLMHLLRQSPQVGEVTGARNGVEALRLLKGARFDAVFLDVNMPRLDGVELATVLAGLVDKPVIVFVTAYEKRAAEAYALDAVDYVLKPLRPERIEDALQRVRRRLADRVAAAPDAAAEDQPDDMAAIAIDDGRRTFFVRREEVVFAEAHRDYVHLHAVGANPGVHIVRIPLSVLEASLVRARLPARAPQLPDRAAARHRTGSRSARRSRRARRRAGPAGQPPPGRVCCVSASTPCNAAASRRGDPSELAAPRAGDEPADAHRPGPAAVRAGPAARQPRRARRSPAPNCRRWRSRCGCSACSPSAR